MKKFTYLFAIVIILFACSPAKIATVNSNELTSNQSNYVFENDTVKITYSFWNDRGVMKYNVYNKINVPLYIDWKKSAYIPNDKMVSYWIDATNTDGNYAAYSTFLGASGASKSKSIRQERIAVIPPKSMITQQDYKLSTSVKELKLGTFNEENSPLRFRNYLSYSTDEKFEGKVYSVDNSFYVSSVKKTNTGKLAKMKTQTSFYTGFYSANP